MGSAVSWEQAANRERAQKVLDRQAREGHTHRDMSPAWLLGTIAQASPEEVTFAKLERDGVTDTMGVAVFKDHPEQNVLEIRGIFGPGMGDALFGQAERRARSTGRKDVIAHATPGAKEAYRARGFATDGPQRSDGAQPMRKAVDLRATPFQTIYPGALVPSPAALDRTDDSDRCFPFAKLMQPIAGLQQSTCPPKGSRDAFKTRGKTGDAFKTVPPPVMRHAAAATLNARQPLRSSPMPVLVQRAAVGPAAHRMPC